MGPPRQRCPSLSGGDPARHRGQVAERPHAVAESLGGELVGPVAVLALPEGKQVAEVPATCGVGAEPPQRLGPGRLIRPRFGVVVFRDGRRGVQEIVGRSGLTQTQFARALGVSQQFVSKMLRGERPVPGRIAD